VCPPDKGEDTDPERVLAVIGKDQNWKYDNDHDSGGMLHVFSLGEG